MEHEIESQTIRRPSSYLCKIGEPEKNTSAVQIIKRRVSKTCSSKYLKKRLPILEWLPKYSGRDLLGDCIAGLSVGLTILPQGIAYGFLAGLSPDFGLNSCYIGCFLYAIFGSCMATNIGPTAITAMLTHEYAHGNPDAAILLCFTTGIIILLFGIFNLGFLCSFISKPVLTGFVSGASITIACSQLKALVGLKIKGHDLIGTLKGIALHFHEINWPDFALGVTCILALTFLRKIGEMPRLQISKEDGFHVKFLKKGVFFLRLSRNAVIVLTAAVIAYIFDSNQPFTITGDVSPVVPTIQLPPFLSNSTNDDTMDLMKMVSNAGAGIFILPLIVTLETIAIGNAFSHGKIIDATQEIYAIGLCNMIGSFFQIMPTAGAFSRSSINEQSGVRTTAGGIVTGILVIVTMTVLTPFLRYIPLTSLAAVILTAVVRMIKYQEIVPIWNVRKIDELVLWVSFLVCVFWNLEFGLLFGVLINLLVLLYSAASPKVLIIHVSEEQDLPQHIVIESRLGLLYVNVDHFRTKTTKAALKLGKGVHPVIIDCSHFSVIDYSASCGMKSMCEDFKNRCQPIFFMNVSPGVKRGLRATNPNIQIIESKSLRSKLLDISKNKSKMELTNAVPDS